jgi:hypothetical protein
MPRMRWISLSITTVLCVLSLSCGKGGQQPNLHLRILAANVSRFCRLPDACFNPNVLAIESGYFVTTFNGSKPEHERVPANGLAKYLQALPVQAWPRGPSITISPSDDVLDPRAVEQNFNAAQQLCRSLGLAVQVRPGG